MELPIVDRASSFRQKLASAKLDLILSQIRQLGIEAHDPTILPPHVQSLRAAQDIRFHYPKSGLVLSWGILDWDDSENGPTTYLSLIFAQDTVNLECSEDGWILCIHLDNPVNAGNSPVVDAARMLGLDPYAETRRRLTEGEALKLMRLMARYRLSS